MVSVVRYAVNNFREQFFCNALFGELAVLVQVREKGSIF